MLASLHPPNGLSSNRFRPNKVVTKRNSAPNSSGEHQSPMTLTQEHRMTLEPKLAKTLCEATLGQAGSCKK